MKDKTKMILCFIGLVFSSQIQWFMGEAEFFNGLGVIFGIGIGWYAGRMNALYNSEEGGKSLNTN